MKKQTPESFEAMIPHICSENGGLAGRQQLKNAEAFIKHVGTSRYFDRVTTTRHKSSSRRKERLSSLAQDSTCKGPKDGCLT